MSSTQIPDPIVAQVRAMLGRGEKPQAIAQLRGVCNNENNNPEHWFLYGVVLAEAADFDGASKAFAKVVELAPLNIMALTNLGRTYAALQKHTEAIEVLNKVVSINPSHKPALMLLVTSSITLHDFDTAEEICTSLNTSSPYDAETLLNLGLIQKYKNNFEQALDFYDQALEVQSDSVPVLINKGLTLQSMGRLDDAILLFQFVALQVPAMAQIWHILAMAWLAKADLTQTIECFEKAFELNPLNIEAGVQLAKAYRHAGKTKESEITCMKILEVDPDNAEARFFQNAYSKQENEETLDRIPAEVTRQMYKGKSDRSSSLGKSFNDSLTENLDYKAPDVLDKSVRQALQGVSKKIDILELGCGSGLCGSKFSDIANQLVGTDISPDMLEGAKEKNTYTDLYDGDLIDVIAKYESEFDLVVAMDVLCFFGDLTEIFQLCHKTLREQGIFGFSVVKPKTEALYELQTYGHFVHSLKHLQQVAEKTGFKQIFAEELCLRKELNLEQFGYVCLYQRL